MSVQEALDVALDSEIKAYEFYQGAHSEVDDESLKKLLIDLRDQEVRHQEMIKEIMARVPDMDTFDPDDFVDEPTAQ
jgi:rubrerythrin